MVNICSLSLWGCAYEYWSGALQNARLHKSLRSGYDIFIFTDISSLRQALVDPKIRIIVDELEECSTLITIDRTPGYMGMFWRMLPFLWEGVERVIVRDADSILTSRELEAVRHWERSRYPFHIMRDHPAHTAAVMGGMFGGIVDTQMRKIFEPLKSLLLADRQYKLNTGWQVDQVFLKRYVFPLVSQLSLIHDPFYDRRSFPTVRQGTEYVGDAVTRKNIIMKTKLKLLKHIFLEIHPVWTLMTAWILRLYKIIEITCSYFRREFKKLTKDILRNTTDQEKLIC